VESIRKDVDFALEALGTDYIDIIVLCRVPSDIPIEESVLSLKTMVDEGKARHIALSEANGDTIRRAHAVYPLYCIEQEWSLWSRDIEEDIVPTCRELGIKIVAYSPLGRGFLTGSFTKEGLDPTDMRVAHSPKFSEDNIAANQRLVDGTRALADKKGCTVGQLALAWLHAQGSDVIPIPGTTSVDHFDQNYAALKITLSAEDLAEIDSIFRPDAVQGQRYAGNHFTFHQNKK
jgi:aryl-alcohol dehydrogenase-like predicted oxidoreductase